MVKGCKSFVKSWQVVKVSENETFWAKKMYIKIAEIFTFYDFEQLISNKTCT